MARAVQGPATRTRAEERPRLNDRLLSRWSKKGPRSAARNQLSAVPWPSERILRRVREGDHVALFLQTFATVFVIIAKNEVSREGWRNPPIAPQERGMDHHGREVNSSLPALRGHGNRCGIKKACLFFALALVRASPTRPALRWTRNDDKVTGGIREKGDSRYVLATTAERTRHDPGVARTRSRRLVRRVSQQKQRAASLRSLDPSQPDPRGHGCGGTGLLLAVAQRCGSGVSRAKVRAGCGEGPCRDGLSSSPGIPSRHP
jgi:hypothetical protein